MKKISFRLAEAWSFFCVWRCRLRSVRIALSRTGIAWIAKRVSIPARGANFIMETFEDRLNQILFQSPSGVRILSYDVLYEEIEVYSFNPRKGCEFHSFYFYNNVKEHSFNPRKGCEFHFKHGWYHRSILWMVSIPARGVNFIGIEDKTEQRRFVSIPARGVNFIWKLNKLIRFIYVSIPARGVNFIKRNCRLCWRFSVSIPARGVNFIPNVIHKGDLGG